MVTRLTIGGIVLRYVFAFSLVCLTWNPSPYCYSKWALNNWQVSGPFVMFSGLVLTIAWVVFLRASARSLGWFGAVLALAVAGSIFWMIVDFGLINPANHTTLSWVLLTLLAAVLTAGMSWSLLRRRWTGQIDVDDVDNVGD